MAIFTLEAKGADLRTTKDGIPSKTRINLFEIEIKITNNIFLFLPNGTEIDFTTDTVTGYATPEALGDQIGLWIKEANTGS
jgi:hypothetical protein